MYRRHKILTLLLVIFLARYTTIPASALAGETGAKSANFLNIPIDPATRAMGGNSAGLLNTALSSLQNPSGLANLKYPELSFVSSYHIENTREQALVFSYPLKNAGTLMVNAMRFDSGDFQGYDANGSKTSMVDATDMYLKLGFGREIIQKSDNILDFGLEFEYLHEKLAGLPAGSYGTGFGAKFTSKGWKLGAAAQHIGMALKYDKDKSKAPMIYRTGLFRTFNILGDSMTIGFGLSRFSEGRSRLNTGLEYVLENILFTRVGFSNAKDIGPDFQAGIGLKIRLFQLDYSWEGYGKLGDSHNLSISLKFAPAAPDYITLSKNSQHVAKTFYKKGTELFELGRYAEAILEFNKVLEMEPDNTDAITKLHESYKEMKEEQ